MAWLGEVFSCGLACLLSVNISSVITGSFGKFSLCFPDVYEIRVVFTGYFIDHIFGLAVDR